MPEAPRVEEITGPVHFDVPSRLESSGTISTLQSELSAQALMHEGVGGTATATIEQISSPVAGHAVLFGVSRPANSPEELESQDTLRVPTSLLVTTGISDAQAAAQRVLEKVDKWGMPTDAPDFDRDLN